MSGMRKPRWLKVYGTPVVVGALSLAGLLSALLLGDPGRIFAWAALAVPPAIVIGVLFRTL